jgi:parallel beta-helix repeat protein
MGQNAIYNNTFYGNGANGILLEDSPGNVVVNNIVARNKGAGIIGNTLFNIPISNNLFFETGSTAGDGQVNADPLFVDADKGDFRLRGESPAIDRGADIGLPKVGQQDIGAYEYGLAAGEDPVDRGGCSIAGGVRPPGWAVLMLALALCRVGRRSRCRDAARALVVIAAGLLAVACRHELPPRHREGPVLPGSGGGRLAS